MTSLNYLLKQLKAISEAHTQVNSYAQGQRYDFGAAGAMSYPCVWAVPRGATPDIQNGKISYQVEVIIMDLEQSGGENQIEILSDTALILTDIIAQLQATAVDFDEWDLPSVSSFEPFVDGQLDTVSGHTCTITFDTFFASDTCSGIFNEIPAILEYSNTDGDFLLWT